MHIYVNGTEQTYSSPNNGVGVASDLTGQKFSIGASQLPSHYFTGFMDDVRVYNRVLSASEVATLAAGNANTGSGVYKLGSALTLNGDLNIVSGGLDVSSSNYGVTLAGNYQNCGSFNAQNGTVTLNNLFVSQTLAGDTVFYNLYRAVGNVTLYLDYAGRQTINNLLTLRGVARTTLLRSTKSGSGARIVLNAVSGTQNINHTSVSDIDASGGKPLICLLTTGGCINGGNNTNWIFSYSITGKVYSDEGVTPLVGAKVGLSLNGGAVSGTGTTDNGGQYTITNSTMTGGSIMSLYLSGNANKAVTVTLSSGATMTGMNLYANNLIVRSDSGAVAITNAQLKVAQNRQYADISSIYNVDSSNTLQVAAGKQLYVWGSKTFTPGAPVKATNVKVLGTMTLGANALTVTGSLIANAGTMTTSTGITLAGVATNNTLSLESNAVQNLTINNGLIAYWNFDTMSQGNVVKDSSGNGNNGTRNGTGTVFSTNVPTTKFYNPRSMSFNGSNDYVVKYGFNGGNNKQGSVSFWVYYKSTRIYNGFVTSDSNVPSIFDANGPMRAIAYDSSQQANYIDVADSSNIPLNQWTHYAFTYTNANGRLYRNGVKVGEDLTGTGAVAIPNNVYIGDDRSLNFRAMSGLMDDVRIYNRSLSASEVAALAAGNANTGSGTYTLGSALTVNGNLNIVSGGLDVSASNYGVNLAGNYQNFGSFNARSGTVTLNGTMQTLTGSTVFYNVSKTTSAATTIFFDYTGRQSAS